MRFPNFTPSVPHRYLTLSFLWGRLCLRLMEGAPEGGDSVWPFPLSHSRLLKADTGQGSGGGVAGGGLGGWRIQGSPFFFLIEKTLYLWVLAVLL